MMDHYIPAAFSQGPVTSLQSMLRAIAFVEQQFPVIPATGRFDEATLETVLRFQKQNHLPVTGVVNKETWDSIASAFINAYRRLPPTSVPPYALDNRSIQPGQSYPALYPIQGMLNGLAGVLDGISKVASTGKLDPTTEQNLRHIQRSAGLPENGVLDRATWEALVRLFRTFLPEHPIRRIDASGKDVPGHIKKEPHGPLH